MNYSTLGQNMKRRIYRFCECISNDLSRPAKKFIMCMIFGLLSSQSCYLTEIARKLKESIPLDKTVERLSRNLMNFDGAESLREQYLQSVGTNFDASTILIFDDSDVSKSCSSKLEGLCRIRDGSTGKLTTGYWSAGVSALTAKRKQPIPVYSRLYSSEEKGYISNNAETLKALGFVGTLSEKVAESLEVLEIIEASKRLYGLSKFTFYAIADGLFEIFGKLYSGIGAFFRRTPPSDQPCFFGCR